MKKLILLLAFIVGILSANAQKISIKVSVPNRVTHQIFINNKHYNSGQGVSIGGSIEFSKTGEVKFKLINTQNQEEINLTPHPISIKQLQKEKETLTEIK